MSWAWLSDFLQIFADTIPRPLIVRTDERVVEFVLGKYVRELQPGWYVKWPAFAAYTEVPVKLQICSKMQRFGDKSFNWKLAYTIENAKLLVTETYDFDETIAELTEIAVGDYYRSGQCQDLMSKESRAAILGRIKRRLSELGVDVRNFSVASYGQADLQISIWELAKES